MRQASMYTVALVFMSMSCVDEAGESEAAHEGEPDAGRVEGDTYDEGCEQLPPEDHEQQPRVLVGSYVVRNVLDLEELNSYQHVTGDVHVQANGMDSVELDVERIDGLLVCHHNSTLTLLRAPRLVAAGSINIESNPSLEQVELPALERVSQNLEFERNAATALCFERLIEVGETLFIARNEALSTLSMPSLTRVRSAFLVQNNHLLSSCDVDAILEQLVGFDGALGVEGNRVEDCTML